MAWRVGVARGDVTAAIESSARPQSENFRRLRARPLTDSPTTSRIASGSPRNRCDHCLDCEETLPARSLTSARGWSDWECPLCASLSNP